MLKVSNSKTGQILHCDCTLKASIGLLSDFQFYIKKSFSAIKSRVDYKGRFKIKQNSGGCKNCRSLLIFSYWSMVFELYFILFFLNPARKYSWGNSSSCTYHCKVSKGLLFSKPRNELEWVTSFLWISFLMGDGIRLLIFHVLPSPTDQECFSLLKCFSLLQSLYFAYAWN